MKTNKEVLIEIKEEALDVLNEKIERILDKYNDNEKDISAGNKFLRPMIILSICALSLFVKGIIDVSAIKIIIGLIFGSTYCGISTIFYNAIKEDMSTNKNLKIAINSLEKDKEFVISELKRLKSSESLSEDYYKAYDNKTKTKNKVRVRKR